MRKLWEAVLLHADNVAAILACTVEHAFNDMRERRVVASLLGPRVCHEAYLTRIRIRPCARRGYRTCCSVTPPGFLALGGFQSGPPVFDCHCLDT